MPTKNRAGRKYVAVTDVDASEELPEGQLRVQEFPRPDSLPGGRLRVVGYPDYPAPPVSVLELPLTFGSYENAIAQPRQPDAKAGGGRVGAIYTADGNRVDASHRGKFGRGWDANPQELPTSHRKPARVIEGRSFYGGHWGPVFGHILLETLPRFWPEVDYDVYDHLVFYPKRLETTKITRQSYIDQLIAGAGPARADFIMLTHGGARFEQIDIASAPVIMKDAVDVRFLNVYDRMVARLLADKDPDAPRPKRVYLSRSHLNPKRKRIATNEDHIEELVQKWGFEIIHPQELSIPHQVSIMCNAEVIAGCDGSGMHMSAFARPGTKLLVIDSRTVPNQFLIDQARQLDAVHVLAVDAPLDERDEKWRIQGQKVRLGMDMLLS